LKLRRAWKKYGEENFKFEVLLNCTFDSLHYFEEFFILKFDSADSGYNIEKIVSGRVVPSAETRKKLAAIWRGRKHTAESRALMSRNKKGVPLSDDHRKALTGVKKKDITRVRECKLGEKNPNFGRPRDLETCRKISEAQKGKPRPISKIPMEEINRRRAETRLRNKLLRKPLTALQVS
jgi:group I intron endonuclease